MLCDKNEMIESRNFSDGVNFTRNDPCIFVTYPPGAAGDLLISIIDKHYLQTGCEYYGIANNGRVCMLTADYEIMDLDSAYTFTEQWFYDLADTLGSRRLNYSLLDQIIFGCHMRTPAQIQYILDTFPNAKIINIAPVDIYGEQLLIFLERFKLNNIAEDINKIKIHKEMPLLANHERVLTIPFGALFSSDSYYKYYDQIINFLNLNGRLICFDYIQYYLSKQHADIQNKLINYSKKLQHITTTYN